MIVFAGGSRTEVQGYEVKGKVVWITTLDGKLNSVLTSFVDLETTEALNRGARAEPVAASCGPRWSPQPLTRTPNRESFKPIPVLTGYGAYDSSFDAEEMSMSPLIAPIVLFPIGSRVLIETEIELHGDFDASDDQWKGEYETVVEYLQVDFIVNGYLTVVAGRFLTPFGVFNERLHPPWIKKLQLNPLISPIGTGSSNGLMLRGGAQISSGLDLNYSGYYSLATDVASFAAQPAVGTRLGFFLPEHQLEVGASFQRQLQDERFDNFGFDATWQPSFAPLELRGELARGLQGQGYWTQAAYRLFDNHEFVVRMEQFSTPSALPGGLHVGDDDHQDEHDLDLPDGASGDRHAEEDEPSAGHHGFLPEQDTRRLRFGWNYYLRDGLKLSFSFGRSFTAAGDHNLGSVGISHRFVF